MDRMVDGSLPKEAVVLWNLMANERLQRSIRYAARR